MKKLFILLTLSISATSFAHSGGTNSAGCHHDRKRGGYHCHKSDGTMVTEQTTRNPASDIEKKSDAKVSKKEKINSK